MHQPVSAAAAYADLKANHQDTARLCSAQGICFRPMVAETTGAWDKSAAHVLHKKGRRLLNFTNASYRSFG
jgi:hypothetical protein